MNFGVDSDSCLHHLPPCRDLLVDISDLAGGWIQAVFVLHLARELLGEHRMGIADQTLQTVSGALIKCHGHQS
jgi:hypothetical protein